MAYIITTKLCEALGLDPAEVVGHWITPQNCSPDAHRTFCRIVAETEAMIIPDGEFEDYVGQEAKEGK